jgi:hypothetical protein
MAKKKDTRMSKSTSQRYHAQKKFFERYESPLTKDQYNMLCSLIKDKKINVTLLDKQTNRVSVYKIYCDLHKEPIIAVYDKQRKKICTFLPIGITKDTIVWEKYSDEQYEMWDGEINE